MKQSIISRKGSHSGAALSYGEVARLIGHTYPMAKGHDDLGASVYQVMLDRYPKEITSGREQLQAYLPALIASAFQLGVMAGKRAVRSKSQAR